MNQVSPAARERAIANLVARTADEPDANGCLIWRGSFSGRGYGSLTLWVDGRSRTVKAHRLAFHIARGPIPAGMTLDHLCRNPSCVNPEHLEPVTHRENILRGTAPSSVNATKTHCNRGHLLQGANLVPNSVGRICRECQRARQASREYLDKNAARQRRYRAERRALKAVGEAASIPAGVGRVSSSGTPKPVTVPASPGPAAAVPLASDEGASSRCAVAAARRAFVSGVPSSSLLGVGLTPPPRELTANRRVALPHVKSNEPGGSREEASPGSSTEGV